MKDAILKGTGNSQYLKTAVPEGTTWEEALAMLRAGTFPIDLNGTNAAGFTQMGTVLNAQNLFSDAAAEALGLDDTAVPNDALTTITTKVGALEDVKPFWATYGQTTSEELENCWQNNIPCFMREEDVIHRLSRRVNASCHVFEAMYGANGYFFQCENGEWYKFGTALETKSNADITYSNTQKNYNRIRRMIQNFAPLVMRLRTTKAWSEGDVFVYNSGQKVTNEDPDGEFRLYRVTQDIPYNSDMVEGTNIEKVTVWQLISELME